MRLRTHLLVVAVLFGACGGEPPAEAVPDPAELALRETILRADALAKQIEEILEPVPLMRPAEEETLRRHLAPAHLARARSLGDLRRWDERQTPGAIDWPGYESIAAVFRNNPPVQCYPIPQQELDTNPNL